VVLAMLVAAAIWNTAATVTLGRGRLRFDRTAVVLSMLLALCTVAGNIGVAGSLARVEPAITSVVLQTQIIFVALAELALLRVRITGSLMLGALLALIGFTVMQAPWAMASAGDVPGTMWALLAALVFALMLVLTRRVIAVIDPLTVNALRLWMAVALMAAWPGQIAGVIALDLRVWLLVAAAALCGPTISRLMLMQSVRHISASQTKLITLVSPLFALLLGWLVFGVLPSAREMLGGCILLCGVALPLLQMRRESGTA